MTTFTTEDRIIAEKDGSFTINVEGGTVTASPPHIVDSGASVINNEPVAWIALNQLNNTYSAFTDSDKERMLPHVQQLYANWIPLYTHPANESFDRTASHMAGEYVSYPAKTLTDAEIDDIASMCSVNEKDQINDREFARAILKKASEK
jgi:hypothetical protein